jgi:hypothetical protein
VLALSAVLVLSAVPALSAVQVRWFSSGSRQTPEPPSIAPALPNSAASFQTSKYDSLKCDSFTAS